MLFFQKINFLRIFVFVAKINIIRVFPKHMRILAFSSLKLSKYAVCAASCLYRVILGLISEYHIMSRKQIWEDNDSEACLPLETWASRKKLPVVDSSILLTICRMLFTSSYDWRCTHNEILCTWAGVRIGYILFCVTIMFSSLQNKYNLLILPVWFYERSLLEQGLAELSWSGDIYTRLFSYDIKDDETGSSMHEVRRSWC